MSKDSNAHTKKLVLLDMHAILHRAYHALPDFSTSRGEPTGALYGLCLMILKLIDELHPDYFIACYDLAGPTFRKELYDDYKAGRAKTEEALIEQINHSRRILEAFSIPFYELEGFEADDLLGTIAERLKNDKHIEIVVASGDMDTLQLVDGKRVQVYTLKRGIKDTVLYDEDAVRERFGFGPEMLADYKGLRGDPSDNIPGVPGVGEKTATTLITEIGGVGEIYEAIAADEKRLLELPGISERILGILKDNQEEAEFSKMLAEIRLDAPIDFTLPEREWKDELDEKRVVALLDDLEFRSLSERVRTLFGLVPTQSTLMSEDDVDEMQLQKAKVALWLLDSTKTNPELRDILSYTRMKTLPDALSVLEAKLQDENLWNVYEDIELPLIPVIEKMNKRGVVLDVKYLKELSGEYHSKLSSLEHAIYTQAGKEFNINSPKQLSEILFETLSIPTKGVKKTSTGSYSTRESELQKLQSKHEIVDVILAYRELHKLLSTYIDNLPQMVDEDGRLRATFLQTGTTTGRMASQNPNLQNIPIKSDLGSAIREAFVATEGYVLLALDYSQIELRVAAMLSGDTKLLSIFKDGRDVHSEVAAEVFGVRIEDVDLEMRRRAKVINFGILYGMGVNALRQNLGADVSQKEAKEYLENYFNTFSGLASWIEEIKKQVGKNGYTATYFGRKRYFPDINSRVPYMRAAAERMAVNAPIQGTQSDVIKKAMVEVDRFVAEEGLEDDVYLLMQIHDELIYEVREEKLQELAPRIRLLMEGILTPEETGGIVFRSDAQAGSHWGDLKLLK